MAHANNCLVHEDGPCDCGFEEILEDEAAEIAAEELAEDE
jgi:hypothetical protein